jgi:hypothetical protein
MKISNKKIKKLIRESIKYNLIKEIEGPDQMIGGVDAYKYVPGDPKYDHTDKMKWQIMHSNPDEGRSKRFEDLFDKIVSTASDLFVTIAKLNPAIAAVLDIKEIIQGTMMILESFYPHKAVVRVQKMFRDGVSKIVGVFLGMGMGKFLTGPIVKGFVVETAADAAAKAMRTSLSEGIELFVNEILGKLSGKVVEQVTDKSMKVSTKEEEEMIKGIKKASQSSFKGADLIVKNFEKKNKAL